MWPAKYAQSLDVWLGWAAGAGGGWWPDDYPQSRIPASYARLTATKRD